jgi:LacI family transcriptional regulator
MAIGMYNYLDKTNLRVGEHIHIFGFDNIDVAQYIPPRLASIDYSEQKWGALSAEHLLKLLADESVENERIYVSLIEGGYVRKVQ